jgi:ectoine hydroxylase-related dioxygenase (phytanoyl-CoA dioxygenase family)
MPTDSDALIRTATSLLARLDFTAQELEEHTARALDPAYWRELNPALSLFGTGDRKLEGSSITAAQMDEHAAAVTRHGYFHCARLLDDSAVAKMRAAVEVLCAHDWLPVFGFMYDEFWLVTRGPRITQLLQSLLGPGYVQRPGVWAHRVLPHRGATGWQPHVDSYGAGDTPGHFSIWIALSDATLENGCMYVLPRDMVEPGFAEHFSELKTVTAGQLWRLLQRAHALPGLAGTVMGWDFNVIHWGSTALDGGEARISVAVEFAARQHARFDPRNLTADGATFDPGTALPSFPARLRMVAESIAEYARLETMARRFLPLAERLLKTEAVLEERHRAAGK